MRRDKNFISPKYNFSREFLEIRVFVLELEGVDIVRLS